MRKLSFFPFLFGLAFFLLPACDDSSGGSKPAVSPELSTVVAMPVRYDTERGAFVTQVTVTVVNVKEQPVAGASVYLDRSSENAIVNETEILTDAEGKAVFEVISHHIEDVEITAFEVKKTNNDAAVRTPLAEPVTIQFRAFLTIEPVSDPIYTAQSGTFALRLHLTDEVGDVAGAELAYQLMDNGLTLSPEEMVTNDSGVAEFTASTSRADTYGLDFQLAGIEEFLSTSVDLLGPAISGSISVGMSYPVFTNPRVGVFGLNIFEETPSIFGELPGSVPVDMNADEPAFQIHLPIVPPYDWLREVRAGIQAGYFPPALYNDDNENGMWDPEEFIIAAHGTPGALVFIYQPNVPDSPYAGWRFFEELGGRSAQTMPWETAAGAQDMLVTAAPVRTPQLSGTLETPQTNVRVAFYVVDGPLFFQRVQNGENPWTLIFDPAHSTSLLDVPVSSNAFAGEAADPMVLLDAGTLTAWSVTTPVANGFEIQLLAILPFSYVDTNGNGSLDSADMPATTLAPPYGVTWQISYIVDIPRIGGFFSTDHLWMHAGWNWIANPKEYEILQVIVNMPGFPTLQVDDTVPAGLSNISFEVLDPATGDVKASGSFESGTMADYLHITECINCQDIQVGDRLRVTNEIPDTTFIDWDQPLVFAPIYGP